ncbi:putative alpha/beta hydrolase [Microdochium trichocladiopsis]|uniref:Alpha/beta hydrolase n=1 Tax=Microdochium trichocladiopsis TaxID=1682393 RepID=A0A9P8Y7R8_9PEZI|nr:putative alpha/beta hydrolase [Microdochium trichocladiopsis]KAH7031268.1 putative alpha/beta hydrolase [Microdochium trichocladiopsis]
MAPANDSQGATGSQEHLPTPPTGRIPQTKKAFFPLGYKEAAFQWWHSVTPPIAERNVIAHIPYLREAIGSLESTPSADHPGAVQSSARTDPYGPRTWRSMMVPLSGKNRELNEFSVQRDGEEVDDTLVMLHGYGAGLGFFYKNFEPITRNEGWKLYALDMLGMGNSTRPTFHIKSKDPAGKIDEAESWFVDALEEWRKIRKIEKFTLLGHSMGGYLAVSYALKYPGHLNKLILASPVGVPEDPYAANADMPEPQESTFQDEFTVDQEATTRSTGNANSRLSSPGSSGASTPKKRPYPGWLTWLWDANVSPFSIVRLTGPLGPRFVSGWTSRRFNHLPEEERQTLHDYAYSLFRQPGSGEYALPYLLAPGAHARRPVINRIQDVGRQPIPTTPSDETPPTTVAKETGFPIVFMYGENDWMDVAGGLAAEVKVREARERALQTATPEEKARENGGAKVIVVTRAGHHLYLDNPDEFNEYLREELEDTRRQTLKERVEQAKRKATLT